MAKKAWLRFLLPGVLILIVGVGLLVKFGMERAVAEEVLAKFPDRGVPRMNITLNGVTLEEINAGSKDVKYEGNEVTVYEGDSATLEASGVRVKGRGNGTWMQEKRPYQIKFDKKVDLFGMGKAKKWVLLANATDASNLRTLSAFYLEKIIGMEYESDGKFVELYVDGDYIGLYYLTHSIEVGKTSVDLRDSMGVLVELDNIYGSEKKHYLTRNGEMLVVKDIVAEDNEEKAMKMFLNSFNELEEAIEKKDYGAISQVADIESFAKYYLLSEFSVNPDAYWTSFFFYKDGVNDKIHAGPGWDFDLAFANRRWGNWMGESFYSPSRTMIRKDELLPKEFYEEIGAEWGYEASIRLSQIMYNMMELPEFREVVSMLYQEKMSNRIGELICYLEDTANEVQESALTDNEKWNKGDYWGEINQMIEWIKQRKKHFDGEYGGVTAVLDNSMND